MHYGVTSAGGGRTLAFEPQRCSCAVCRLIELVFGCVAASAEPPQSETLFGNKHTRRSEFLRSFFFIFVVKANLVSLCLRRYHGDAPRQRGRGPEKRAEHEHRDPGTIWDKDPEEEERSPDSRVRTVRCECVRVRCVRFNSRRRLNDRQFNRREENVKLTGRGPGAAFQTYFGKNQ